MSVRSSTTAQRAILAEVADAAALPLPGRSFPLGSTLKNGGANFSVYAKHSTGAQLLLFDHADDAMPARVIDLNPAVNRTYHYWHVFVPGVAAGQIYGFRVAGPFDPDKGLRFDETKLLLDPYGKAIARPANHGLHATQSADGTLSGALKSVVADTDKYDWEGDKPLGRPFVRTVIYETHLAGFTRNPNSGVPAGKRGTYAGFIEKIPYLVDLGVSAVELLPVFAFDEKSAPQGFTNYWGYQPISFFSPHPAYSSRPDPLGAIDEFRDLVKALHRAGIEVILDVVFNHTAEGDEHGPTYCFRGLANEDYYILAPDKAQYANFTGCGNTLNANEPIVRRLILDSLRYWATEMHVDGFRFDLASILSRDREGKPQAAPPVLWDIESDPILANVKLLAEAWDAAGLYQVGSFAGDSWKEWNGKFRDDVRAFVKGDNGLARAVAYRLTGSPDIFGHKQREAEQSVNFVTCHDGFTLNDVVSYNGKHNEANGENNRDGADANFSWNCGAEGQTRDPEVERLRIRQVKNLLAITLLAVGTPMLLGGDEVRRTQRGNNNGYCQDNELSWFDWSLRDKHADVHRFVKKLIALRASRAFPVARHDLSLNELLNRQPAQWHGVRLNQPDWTTSSHTVAVTVPLSGYGLALHFIVNAYWEALDFELPALADSGEVWRRCIDTFAEPPNDICDWEDAPREQGAASHTGPRSTVVLLARSGLRN